VLTLRAGLLNYGMSSQIIGLNSLDTFLYVVFARAEIALIMAKLVLAKFLVGAVSKMAYNAFQSVERFECVRKSISTWVQHQLY
jgi:hypothetical protein